MKRTFSLFLILSILCSLVSCSMAGTSAVNPIDKITLKLEDTMTCRDCSIKFSLTDDMAASYYITPEGFELDKLEEKGYKMKIQVTYDVYYKKDWDLSFGYAGSPKYEVSIVNSDGLGKIDENLTTAKSAQTRTFSMVSRIVDLKNTKLLLTFSTDNIQNIIYFKNIKVEYRCYK